MSYQFKFNEKPETTELGLDFIKLIHEHGASSRFCRTLRESRKTWGELPSEMKAWCMVKVKDFPIDLTGVIPSDRAYVMVERSDDCPVDLTGLDSEDLIFVESRRGKDKQPEKMVANSETLLQARHKTHGAFGDNAFIGQSLRNVLRKSPNWKEGKLSVEHKEALDYIVGKISRILSGSPSNGDHWDDIIGYATLGAGREGE